MTATGIEASSLFEVATVYTLGGGGALVEHRLPDQRDVGRFRRNMAQVPSFQFGVIPSPLGANELVCPTHGEVPFRLSQALFVVDAGGQTQVIVYGTAHGVAALTTALRCLCFERDDLLTDHEQPWLLELLRATPLGDSHSLLPTEFSLDVHSVVSVSTPVPDLEAVSIVYREDQRVPNVEIPVHRPLELNRFRGEQGLHGRGVTLLAGHQQQTVNAIVLVVHNLLFIQQRLRGIERRASHLLAEAASILRVDDEDEAHHSDAEVEQTRIMSHRARELEIELGFDVENALAAGSLPEIVLDSYRGSLADVLHLPSAAAATSNTLSRVQSFISAGFEGIRSQLYEQQMAREQRRVRWAAVISAIVVPTALLFSFFCFTTTDVAERGSAFSSRYGLVWTFYGLVVALGVGSVVYLTWRRPRRG